MWMETTENPVFGRFICALMVCAQNHSSYMVIEKNQIQPHIQQPSEVFDRYLEDDDTATDTGRTMSSIADSHLQHDSPPFVDHIEESSTSSFEKIMKDPENSRVSRYQNTYFMDGGNRFISVSLFITLIFSHIILNFLYKNSCQHWVTQVPKQHLIFQEYLKIGFRISSTIRVRMMGLRDCPFWKIRLNYLLKMLWTSSNLETLFEA